MVVFTFASFALCFWVNLLCDPVYHLLNSSGKLFERPAKRTKKEKSKHLWAYLGHDQPIPAYLVNHSQLMSIQFVLPVVTWPHPFFNARQSSEGHGLGWGVTTLVMCSVDKHFLSRDLGKKMEGYYVLVHVSPPRTRTRTSSKAAKSATRAFCLRTCAKIRPNCLIDLACNKLNTRLPVPSNCQHK